MTEDRRVSTKAMRELADYFIKNSREELSAEDAAAKLGIGIRYAAVSLSSLAGAGVLERVSVYRLAVVKSPEPSIGMRVAEALKARA